jgi:hypothetical protein
MVIHYFYIALTLDATKKLFSNVPLMYSFNDNDFDGSSSNKNSSLLTTVNSIYRKIFPSYDLPNSGVYQSFKYGNVLFIMADSRTFLSSSTKEFLGSIQVSWIISKLKNVANDPSVGAVFITLPQVWNYVKSEYDWDMVKQNFDSILDSASDDKSAIGDFLNKNFNFNRPTLPGFKSVMMIVGDTTTAFDDGSWNNYGNFPVAVCGPLDYWQQCRGGPYSHGSFHDNPNNFCQFTVYPSGGKTCVKAVGVINALSGNFAEQPAWIYDTCNPDQFRGRINMKCPILYTEKLVNVAITIAALVVVYLIFFVLIHNLALRSLNYSKNR